MSNVSCEVQCWPVTEYIGGRREHAIQKCHDTLIRARVCVIVSVRASTAFANRRVLAAKKEKKKKEKKEDNNGIRSFLANKLAVLKHFGFPKGRRLNGVC